MNFERMRRLTQDLIAIDSVTGGEAELALFLQDVLEQRGWTVERQAVTDKRWNLYARFEPEPPRMLFNSHLDTVPPAYGPSQDHERIYGRGACDTKGLQAAMLEALEAARNRGIGGLGLLLVVGEERDHLGARAAAQEAGLSPPDVLLVGEPTENRFLTAQKGILSGRLIAKGREGHSGYPERFDSAVEKLLPALEALRTAGWLERNSEAGTTLNISLLQGGDAFNKVPGEASCSLMFRLADSIAATRKRTEETLAAAAPEVELHWEPEVASEPVARIDALAGHATGVAAFNTDLPYFGWRPRRQFLLGPGSILQAHRDPVGGDRLRGEWLSKSEQEEGAALYFKLIEEESGAR